MGKSNITLPPAKKATPSVDGNNAADEKKISAVINKGGSPTKTVEASPQGFKNFNIKLPDSQLQTIHELREFRPRPPGQKRPGVSIREWLSEAIQEKIEREKEKYNT